MPKRSDRELHPRSMRTSVIPRGETGESGMRPGRWLPRLRAKQKIPADRFSENPLSCRCLRMVTERSDSSIVTTRWAGRVGGNLPFDGAAGMIRNRVERTAWATGGQPGGSGSVAKTSRDVATGSGCAGPAHARPEHARAEQTSAGHARPGHASAGHARPEHARAEHARAEQTSAGHARPEHARPEHARPEHARPEHARAANASLGLAGPEHAHASRTARSAGAAGSARRGRWLTAADGQCAGCRLAGSAGAGASFRAHASCCPGRLS
jgi:hypothetical protein